MKKSAIILMILLAALLLAAAGFAAFYLSGSRPLTAEVPAIGAEEGDRMTVTAEIGEDMRILSGTQTMTAVNRTGEDLEEIVLRLYANDVKENSVVISEMRADGQDVEYAVDADNPSVLRVRAAWGRGEEITLSWRFHVTIPMGGGFIGRTDSSALIVGALPTLAVYEDDAWHTDALDALAEPSYAQAFNLEMTLFAPASLHAAFGGALVSSAMETAPDTVMYTVRMRGARDIAMALTTDGVVRWREVDGVLVSALAENVFDANRLLGDAQKALQSLDEIGLAYPFPSLTVVYSDTQREDGLIGSGLVAVSPGEEDAEQRLRLLTRLIARQTFGVLVESDPWNVPWLSVTLASTAEVMAYRQRKGEGAFETRFYDELEVSTRLTRPYGVTVGASVEHFGGDAEMSQVLRDQGAAMLLGIEQAVGAEAFLQALSDYAGAGAGQIGTQALLEQALFEATGSRWDGYLNEGLTY